MTTERGESKGAEESINEVHSTYADKQTIMIQMTFTYVVLGKMTDSKTISSIWRLTNMVLSIATTQRAIWRRAAQARAIRGMWS